MEDTAKVIEQLQDKCSTYEQQIAELQAKLNWYEEQFRLSQKQKYGRSSEQSNQQLQLFNEAEAEADSSVAEPSVEEITYTRRKKKDSQATKIKDLPEKKVEYYLAPEEQVCSCGSGLHEMSKETRREIEVIPAQVNVVNHVQYVYACRRCQQEDETTPVVTAPKPEPVLPGSIASPSAISYTITQKYVESMPLYRQQQAWSRLGVEISRQTLANWMIQASERWLTPLYDRMHELLLKKDILHADETDLQVLREPGRSATSKSYIWLYRTGREGPPIVLYDYQTTRASKHPQKFLSGFNGYLHVDGYPGYNNISGVTLVGCWSHYPRNIIIREEYLKAA